MGIKRVEINNCKSIENINIEFKSHNFILGENETGKSNIIKCINYFYNNLTNNCSDDSLYDKENPYKKSFSISIWYDLSEILKRCKSNMQPSSRFYNFYKKVLDLPYDNNNILKLKLVQNTTRGLHWIIPNSCFYDKDRQFDIRKTLEHIFPLYHVDVRSINLHDWNDLWKSIASLVSITTEENKNLINQIPEDISARIRCLEEIDELKRILISSELKIYTYDINEHRKILAKIGLHGDVFTYKDTPLDYRSDGQNSYNYLISLLRVVSLIADRKTRTPIILIDEPELSWHTKYIDSFSRVIEDISENITLVMTSHSPRLVKNLMGFSIPINGFQCRKLGNYTYIYKLKLLDGEENRVRSVINDELINSYFSKAFVIIEGTSDIGVLHNKKLRRLFPSLDSLDIFHGNSNNNELKIVNPIRRGLGTPYISLFDMDKFLECKSELDFSGKYKYSYEGKKEIEKFASSGKLEFAYCKKRIEYLSLNTQMQSILQNKFSFTETWGTSTSTKFQKLILLVKKIGLNNNMFLWSTTIEGALINENSYHLAYDFFKQKHKTKILDDIMDEYPNDKISILRYCFLGKPDALWTINNMQKASKDLNDLQRINLCKKINTIKISEKTNWIDDFIEYFFDTFLINIYKIEENVEVSKRWYNDNRYLNFCHAKFEFYFPELNEFIHFCNKII